MSSPYAPFSLTISAVLVLGAIVGVSTHATPLIPILAAALLGGLPPLLSVFILVVIGIGLAIFSSLLIYYLLCTVWSLFGHEVITLRPEEMQIERSIPLYTQTHTYSLGTLRDMRVEAKLRHRTPGIQFVALPLMSRAGGGPIVFEDRYGSYRMGLPLRPEEAEDLVDTITQSTLYQEPAEKTDSKNGHVADTNPRNRIRDVLNREREDSIESLGDLFRGQIRDTEAYHKYSGVQDLKIESPLPPEECLRRIEITTSDQTVFPSDLDPISAELNGRRIRLGVRQQLKGRKNSFAPLLYGQLHNSGEGTLIEGTFKLHPFVRIFTLIFGLLLSGSGVAIAGMGLTGNLAANPVWIAFPFVLLGLAVLLWYALRSWGKEDRAEIIYFLVKLLEADILESESS